MSDKVTIIKLDGSGEEAWRWQADVLQHTSTALLAEARFDYKEDVITFHGITLRKGDPFIEFYSTRHNYNIFEMHGQEENQLKGWYCNITRPAIITPNIVTFEDLALDLLVLPDGRQIVLDEDEFAELNLSPTEAQTAVDALQELKAIFSNVRSFNIQSLMG
jgi:uncharacterized protein